MSAQWDVGRILGGGRMSTGTHATFERLRANDTVAPTGMVPCATCGTDQCLRDGCMAVYFQTREEMRKLGRECSGAAAELRAHKQVKDDERKVDAVPRYEHGDATHDLDCPACSPEKRKSAAAPRRVARIDDDDRHVTWTETGSIAIGYHNCVWCGAETPSPSDAVVIEFLRSRDRDEVPGVLWPIGRAGEGWKPDGWSFTDEDGRLCPDCTKARTDAICRARLGRAP